jgi:hypothetical protein
MNSTEMKIPAVIAQPAEAEKVKIPVPTGWELALL